MRNILFFIGKYPNFGGTERITTLLANSFQAQGDNVSIVACEQGCDLSLMNLSDKVAVLFLPNSMPKPTRDNVKFLREHIATQHVDIIINQWCLPYYVTQLLNRARVGTNCKLISVLHGMPNSSKKVLQALDEVRSATNPIKKCVLFGKYKLIDAVIKLSIRWVYAHSDKYVLLSPRFFHMMHMYAGISLDEKILSISNPITIPTQFDDTSSFSTKKKQLLYVGRLDKENKRVNRILEIWNDLYQKHSDWNLVLVGDGPEREELEQYVLENKIERVTFTGFIKEDPIEYYKESSIFLLTSDLEGFGLVILEAMCYGVVPVVYGSYAAVYDIITDGQDGFVTSVPFNHQEMEDRVEILMNEDCLRSRMANNAIGSSKRFNIQNILQQWNKLFDQIS